MIALIKPIILIQLTCVSVITIFVREYYETIYGSSNEACFDFGRCDVKILDTSLDITNVTDVNTILSTLCPAMKCEGNDFCCDICQAHNLIKDEIREPRPVNITTIDTLKIAYIPYLLIGGTTTIVCIGITIWITTYCALNKTISTKDITIKKQQEDERKEDDSKKNTNIQVVGHKHAKNLRIFSIFIGILSLLSILLLLIVIIIAIYAISIDIDFYRNCHTDFTVILSWFNLLLLMVLFTIFITVPNQYRGIKRIRGKSDAIILGQPFLYTDSSFKASKSLKEGYFEKKIITVLNYIGGISIIFSIVCFAYLLGLENGHWRRIEL